MLKEKTGIGPGLLFCLVFSSVFGFGVMNAPYIAAKYGGSNGYWGIILAFLLSIPAILATVKMGNRFPNKSIIDNLTTVFGRIIGKTLGFIFLILVTVMAAWGTRTIAELFGEFFLPRTPIWAVTLMIIITVGYVAHNGVEGITRVTAFIFPVAVVFILMAVTMSFQGFNLDRVRPFFLIDGFKIPYSTVQLFYCFFPLATVYMIYPYLTEKQKGLKILTGAVFLAIIPIFVMAFSAIGIYGYRGVLRYGWPMLQMTTQANLPYVFQTFGLFFAVSWYSQISLSLAGLYYASAQGFSELLGASNYKLLILVLLPASYILVLMVPGVIDLRYIFKYMRIAGFAVIFTWPIITWLVSLITKTGEVRHAS